MKYSSLLYWGSTVIVAAMILMGPVFYFFDFASASEGLVSMGFPAFLLYIIGPAKLLGGIGILQQKCRMLQEWSYVGLFILYYGAFLTHIFTNTSVVMSVVLCVLTLVSYRLSQKRWA